MWPKQKKVLLPFLLIINTRFKPYILYSSRQQNPCKKYKDRNKSENAHGTLLLSVYPISLQSALYQHHTPFSIKGGRVGGRTVEASKPKLFRQYNRQRSYFFAPPRPLCHTFSLGRSVQERKRLCFNEEEEEGAGLRLH